MPTIRRSKLNWSISCRFPPQKSCLLHAEFNFFGYPIPSKHCQSKQAGAKLAQRNSKGQVEGWMKWESLPFRDVKSLSCPLWLSMKSIILLSIQRFVQKPTWMKKSCPSIQRTICDIPKNRTLCMYSPPKCFFFKEKNMIPQVSLVDLWEKTAKSHLLSGDRCIRCI